ncbi:lincosamide nucleotidyltransferase A/C/D/E [Amycolatopsis pretoriensis]|uniref:Lincosamide nucleotidyltransferase A/C/D/E n=1 Tax=Amycolatopsis pretoriensis TaxID=218821 RepID=A0A1H5R5W9_9PSEU|nr:amino acid transporter [Amycolatopsis pretoriensis]SEF33763.1 lincosamide nucleotidyltransferase A/C/D/E [Amycolatopsis pretoriensis]
MTDAAAVLRVLDAVRPAEVWLAGGWGVDALLGHRTREHRDLDLLHRRDQEPAVLEALAALGYRETRDLRPVRFVLSDGATELDLHPLVFAEDGSAVQAADDRGATFPYPADCFVTGRLLGVPVPCISVAQQVFFHQGYEPRPHDLADMRHLREAFGVDTHF